jgi:hypothetical protein
VCVCVWTRCLKNLFMVLKEMLNIVGCRPSNITKREREREEEREGG